TVAEIFPLFFNIDVYQLIIGLFAVIGHTYPLFSRCNVGKAFAMSVGIILEVSPLLFLVMFVSFMTTLYLAEYVFLSSLDIFIVLRYLIDHHHHIFKDLRFLSQ